MTRQAQPDETPLPQHGEGKSRAPIIPAWPLLLFLVVYATLALAYYQERLFADAGNDVFRVANARWFLDYAGRLGAQAAQISLVPAILAANLDAPINVIAACFSLGIPICAFLVFLYLLLVNRDTCSAIGLALVLVLDENGNFFFPSFLRAASCLMILLHSSLYALAGGNGSESMGLRKLRRAANLLIICACAIVFSYHPTSILCGCFVFGAFILERGRVSWVAVAGGVFLAAMMAVRLLTMHGYESKVVSGFTLQYWSLEYIRKLCGFLIRNYPVTLALLAGSLAVLLVRRRYLYAAFVAAAAAGFLFVLNCSFFLGRNTFAYYHYAVGLWPLFAIVPAMALLRTAPIRFGRWAAAVLFLACAYGVAGIVASAEHFSNRVAYFQRLLSSEAAAEGAAFLVCPKNCSVPLDIPQHMDKETLLLSAILGQKPAKYMTFREDRVPGPKDLTGEPWRHSEMETREALNTPGRVEQVTEAVRKAVSLRLLDVPDVLTAGEVLPVSVLVSNNSGETLHSLDAGPYRLRIGYHWFQNGKAVVWDGLLTPLEVDIQRAYTQPFNVEVPKAPGRYRLAVDLLLINQAWFRIDESVEVRVR